MIGHLLKKVLYSSRVRIPLPSLTCDHALILFLLISGSNVSRLRDFIVEFYLHSGTSQTPDDSFCAFVWSLVVQQPTVRVGTVPLGVTTEVWVAPQTSAKRKALAKGQAHVEIKPPELDIVPDAQHRTLEDLKQEYGDILRIAVHPDAIYAAITGSHIRVRTSHPLRGNNINFPFLQSL